MAAGITIHLGLWLHTIVCRGLCRLYCSGPICIVNAVTVHGAIDQSCVLDMSIAHTIKFEVEAAGLWSSTAGLVNGHPLPAVVLCSLLGVLRSGRWSRTSGGAEAASVALAQYHTVCVESTCRHSAYFSQYFFSQSFLFLTYLIVSYVFHISSN